jgi:hypothetical protein
MITFVKFRHERKFTMFSFTKKAAQDISLPELTEDQLNQVAGGTCSHSSDSDYNKYHHHHHHHHHKHHQWHKNTRGSHGSGWNKSSSWSKTQYGSDSHW